jgi:hypothetical protein
MATLDHNGTDSDWPNDTDLDFYDMELGDDAEAALEPTYTGLTCKDISARLQETSFGSDFCSSRREELDSVCQMVFAHGDIQRQEVFLQRLRDNREYLISGQSLALNVTRLKWPCSSCGGNGHRARHCPAHDSAAAAEQYLDQAEGPVGSVSAEVAADKKARKRAKQAAKRAAAEKAATATNGSSTMADGELSEAAATSLAAPDDAASVVHSADGGTADAATDTEQPEQKEHAERGHIHGAASKETGDADSEQVRCYSDLHGVMLSATTGEVNHR